MNLNTPSLVANSAAVGAGTALTAGTFATFLNPGPDTKPPYGPIAWAFVNITGSSLTTCTARFEVSTDGSTFVGVGPPATTLAGSATAQTGLVVCPIAALLTHPTTGVAVTHVRVFTTSAAGTITWCNAVTRTDYV